MTIQRSRSKLSPEAVLVLTILSDGVARTRDAIRKEAYALRVQALNDKEAPAGTRRQVSWHNVAAWLYKKGLIFLDREAWGYVLTEAGEAARKESLHGSPDRLPR